jgi:hypothetical protein
MYMRGGEILKKQIIFGICGEMAEEPSQTAYIIANICGEMSPDDIPAAPGIDITALKSGDDDPMEVVVEIPAGKAKRGWNYKPKALKDIVGEIMVKGLPGFLGHQKPEDVPNQFPTPVTHWVGAIMKGNSAYVRGVVDKSAADLKRWIRGKMIKEVSIFGQPQLQQVRGEIDVVGYAPLSIDWSPLGRAGMPTRIVSIGEMNDITGELDGSHEELRDMLQAAVRELLTPNGSKQGYVYIRKVYDDRVIVEQEDNGKIKLYQLPFTVKDEKVIFGNKTEVTRKESFVPITVHGEIDIEGGKSNVKEVFEKLKAMMASGEITRAQFVAACGEMLGINLQEVTGEMAAVQTDAATLAKVKTILGVTGEMDVTAVATEAGEALEAKRKADHKDLADTVIGEKVSGEMNQEIIRGMLHTPIGATKEQISGEIDSLLASETVKNLFGKLHLDSPAPRGGQKPAGDNALAKTRTVSI